MRQAFAQLPKSLLLALLVLLSPHLPEVWALHGDSWCGTYMCVTATVKDSMVTYELESFNQSGWMAIGFGSGMANTPMVIVWQTQDGITVLSQRQASGRVEPLPVPHPPRLARLSHRAISSSLGADSALAFDIPGDNNMVQSLIWAFGVTTPDASPTAPIEQHLDAGSLYLDLTKELDIADGLPPSSCSSSSFGELPATDPISPAPSQSSASSGLSRSNGLLVAHAAVSAAGFLIILPLSILVARWSRMLTSKWFTAHWFINVVPGIPLICVGWALGPLAVAQHGGEHIVTAHQIFGVVLFVLYIFEIALGTLIHLCRPKQGASHPPWNVVHVVLGLAVFGISIYETISGIHRDFIVTGASQRVVVAICIGWAAVCAGTYIVGLIFLRKQFAQERLGWSASPSVPMHMPIIAQDMRASSSDPVQRGVWAVAPGGTMADDGTHDVFSEPWASGSVEDLASLETSQDRARGRTEMRQVQAEPVSLSAFL